MSYGLDKELAAKLAGKYDPQKESAAQEWVEAVLGERFPGGFQESLKNGVRLCKLVNRIRAGTVAKYNTRPMAFSERENISLYLNGCRALGARNEDLFDSQDLYDNKNIMAVVDQLHSLSALARGIATFGGPYVAASVRFATKNERAFSDELMAAAANAPTMLAQGDAQAKRDADARAPPISLDRQIVQNVEAIRQAQDASKRASLARFCTHCGEHRDSSAQFCGHCGSKQ